MQNNSTVKTKEELIKEQKAHALHLMNYSTRDNAPKQTSAFHLEESVVAPNGMVYAIIKENNRFYIKTSPQKEVLDEQSFEYLGGGARYKHMYEYTNFNMASKMLSETMRGLSFDHKTPEMLAEEVKQQEQNKFQEPISESAQHMRDFITRQKQIIENA